MWCLFWRSACSREDNTANAAEEGRLPGDTGATSNTRKVRASPFRLAGTPSVSYALP